MFSIFGKDKGDPNATVFCSLDVSKVSTSKQSNQIDAIGWGIASILTSPWKIYKNTAFPSEPRLATSRANAQQTIQYAYMYIYI